MKTFFATIETEYATYYIDKKTKRFGFDAHEFSVMHPTGAVYLCSVQECLDWIEFYDKGLQEQAEAEAVWQLQHA
jgi:hypothetical protein